MRHLQYFILLIIICVSACENSKTEKKYLPDAVGRYDDVLLVMNDADWEDSLGEKFRINFMLPYKVLPQAEPILGINRKSPRQFNTLLKKYKTVFLLAYLDERTPMLRLIEDLIGRDKVAEIIANKTAFYNIKSNIWANGQEVVLFLGASKSALLKAIDEQSGDLLKEMQKLQLKKMKKMVYAHGKNELINNSIGAKFGVQFSIPKDYSIGIEKDNFIWLRKETTDLSSNIMIYKFPNEMKLDEMMTHIVGIRNSLGLKYISSDIEGSYMKVDSTLPIVQERETINGIDIIKTKGLWKIQNDFMGGPFVNYVLQDKHKKKLIMIDGFVHAPKLKKKPKINAIELIINSLEYNDGTETN